MRTHYLNAEFDLSLRPRPRRIEGTALDRRVRELSAQALLGAEEGDLALVRTEITQEFLDHLGECGFTVPGLVPHPELEPLSVLRPFGWNTEAIELNARHERPVSHPPLETIRRVNTRSFALALEAELAPDGPRGEIVEEPDAVHAFLSRAATGSEWVVKSEHGNAGLANRRLTAGPLEAADRRFVLGLFAEDDRVLVEPWLARERDWSLVFDVPFDAGSLRVHETSCTRDGALIGAIFEPGGADCGPWSDELRGAAERVARRLEHERYFGPVCVDAFSWRDGERIRLRPLADLNGRRSMSDGAYRLWCGSVPEQTMLYRFFGRRKLTLPVDLTQAVTALGDERYDKARRRGILLASPPEFAKLAVAFVAEGRPQVFALERKFRAQFEV